jgi:ABC-2 type transport system permease protein
VTARHAVRLVALTWWLHVKMLNRSVFDSVMQVVWPLFFVTVALFIYRADADPQVLAYAALGSSVMTIWTAISSTASTILQRERGQGTLELLVAAPTPFPLSVLSMITAVSTVGAYGVVAALLWAHFLFGVDVSLAQPLVFPLAVVVTIFSFSVLGFILSVTVVRYRAAWALGSAFEYPVWLVCGFLVPASVLPGWLRPAGWILPPSWGMAAIRRTTEGGSAWPDLLTCAGLAAALSVLGMWLAGLILHSARRHATLSLT